jgi:5-methylcytosine-specific restriction endonuclease McrA
MLEKQFEESRNITATKQKRYIRAAPKEEPESLSGTRHIIDRAKRIRRRKISAGTIKSLFMDQEGKCVFCKEPLAEYHVDHIIPIARGGDGREENLQLLCPKCNLSKRAKDPVRYMLEAGIISKQDLFILSGRRAR